MKRFLLIALLWATATGVFAQGTHTDTVTNHTDTVVTKPKHKGFKFTFATGEEAARMRANRHDTTITIKEKSKAPGFFWGLTFARFDLGLSALVDNGSFKLSPQNDFLRYRSWKTINVGFDVIQVGYRFNSSFRMYVSGGFDWTHIRLRDNITIQEGGDRTALHYTNDNIIYSKNRFTSSYFRIPLTFDWRSHDDNSGRRVHIDGGPDIGILYNGRVKQISDENGKEKFNNNYHYQRLRYGVFARVGYGFMGLFAKYYFNDMFDTDQQKGVKNLSFGLTFGF